jgi:hypothetical protein
VSDRADKPAPKYRFWPERPPGPVDDAYAQTRWLRPYRPGLIRVITCLVLLAVLGLVLQTALLTTFAAGDVGTVVVRAAVAVALLVGLGTLFSRCYLSGLWVTDGKVRLVRPLSTKVWAWTDLADVRSVTGPARLLGTPLAIPGSRVLLVLADGSEVETPVSNRSPDFLGRPQAYEMAADAVEGWFRLAHRD